MRLPKPPLPAPLLIGFSGGMDSTVLLHLLRQHARPLRALHVHHGLHAQADDWAAHCQHICDELGVPLEIVHVAVARDSGLGPEGAARAARHAAFAQALGVGEILTLAHHQDDQAETFLLRALRGAGTEGLAAMRCWRPFAGGWLWRPMLDWPRTALHDYARRQGLRWVEDPGNTASTFDRNFLRNQVLPLLRQRWPEADVNFARSATLCAQAGDLLEVEDAQALARVQPDPHTLEIAALQALPPARRARLLRRWIAALGLPPLPSNGIAIIECNLLPANHASNARFDWAGARVQRWRGLLHAGRILPPLPQDYTQPWDGRTALKLPTGDMLTLEGADGFDTPVLACARRGGERIVLPGRGHSHALKHVLQDTNTPPWLRARLPLLQAMDGTVLAAGDAIVSAHMAAWLATRGARLQWTPLA